MKKTLFFNLAFLISIFSQISLIADIKLEERDLSESFLKSLALESAKPTINYRYRVSSLGSYLFIEKLNEHDNGLSKNYLNFLSSIKNYDYLIVGYSNKMLIFDLKNVDIKLENPKCIEVNLEKPFENPFYGFFNEE